VSCKKDVTRSEFLVGENENKMARFASKQDEEIALMKCLNCGYGETHESAEGALTCSRCFTNPSMKIRLDGRHSFSIFNNLRCEGGKDLLDDNVRCQHFPDRQLFFSLLRQKRLIDECNFTLIMGYATEEADYIYNISCFDREIDVLNYLKKNFSEHPDEETTYHVVKIFDRGIPIDFDIIIKH